MFSSRIPKRGSLKRIYTLHTHTLLLIDLLYSAHTEKRNQRRTRPENTEQPPHAIRSSSDRNPAIIVIGLHTHSTAHTHHSTHTPSWNYMAQSLIIITIRSLKERKERTKKKKIK
jgi:hypothetical protein